MIAKTTDELKSLMNAIPSDRSIGLVPTMGFLHAGHLSLVHRAREENDVVVMSIFLNPTQFGPQEDLDSYPRDFKGDVEKAMEAGVDIIFAPTPEVMYPEGYETYVEVTGDRTKVLCGKTRPGHFRGVTTVLTKLFHLTRANRAYFGLKDAQQFSVVRRMVEDLNFPIEVIPCPIVRDEDGLALSSRNAYLSLEERQEALVLNRSLRQARELVAEGEHDAETILKAVRHAIEASPLADVEYVEMVDLNTMKSVSTVDEDTLLAVAVRFGKTRLIDNTLLG